MISLPLFEKFIIDGEEETNKFENLLCVLDIGNDAREKAFLWHYAGDDVIVDTMTDTQKLRTGAMTAENNPLPT